MFLEWRLDNESCCYFCGVGQESTYHVFGSCEKLKGFWSFLSKLHVLLSGQVLCYINMRKNFHLDFTVLPGVNNLLKKTLIYMNTIANYSIWRHRSEIRYNFISFDIQAVVNKFIRSIGARRHIDKCSRLTETYQVPYIEKLYELAKAQSNNFPFDNG